ncbi:hypothetical protein [Ottowia sp.]|uniref:hypothetical protein n=1 Tax=Ottowia sp. TaxID=1898956 RepID=UPI0039E5D5C3
MDLSATAVLIIMVTAAISFGLGRWLSGGWRTRRREKELAAKRASETRQQRRARERREKR